MDIVNKHIAAQLELLYDVSFLAENTMGNSGNIIFEVKRDCQTFFARICAFTPIKIDHIEFELNWVAYLAQRLDCVVNPIKSSNGNLYEVVQIGDTAYIICLFEKAQGKIVEPNNPADFNETLFFNLGAVMGDMHKATIGYPKNKRDSKFEWNNDAYSWRGSVPILDDEVSFQEKKYIDEICQLPTSIDTYGIVHFDIHIDNFFVENNKIKLLDFEACQFNWYAADMASAMFFMVQKGAGPLKRQSEKERTAFAETYLIAYLKGYLQTNSITKYWIKTFDLFMKYQMTDEYRFAQTCVEDDPSAINQWYLDWHKQRIISGMSYVFVDYERVFAALPNLQSQ